MYSKARVFLKDTSTTIKPGFKPTFHKSLILIARNHPKSTKIHQQCSKKVTTANTQHPWLMEFDGFGTHGYMLYSLGCTESITIRQNQEKDFGGFGVVHGIYKDSGRDMHILYEPTLLTCLATQYLSSAKSIQNKNITLQSVYSHHWSKPKKKLGFKNGTKHPDTVILSDILSCHFQGNVNKSKSKMPIS